jgi:hypothetical protein
VSRHRRNNRLPLLNSLDDPTNGPVVHTFDAVDGGDRSNEFVPRRTVTDVTLQNDPASGYVQSKVSAARHSGGSHDASDCAGNCTICTKPPAIDPCMPHPFDR